MIGVIVQFTPKNVVFTLAINGQWMCDIEHDKALAVGLTLSLSAGNGFVGQVNLGTPQFPPTVPCATLAQWITEHLKPE